jgi:hypothetical protein
VDYQIALSPELGLSPEDFVAGWNETPECNAVAVAHMEEAASTQYDPLLIGGAAAVLGGVAINLASNALYDLIKSVLVKRGVRQQVEIVHMDQPDGNRLLVIKIVEG